MNNSLVILFTPIDAIGHVNACIGVAQVLSESGHRIVFAISDQWRAKLSAYGFEEELIPDPDTDPDIDPAKQWTERVFEIMKLMAATPLEKIKSSEDLMCMVLNQNKRTDAYMKDILDRHKPDVIIIDNFFIHPSILKSGIPWVLSWSSNPLLLHECVNYPPPWLGLPFDGNRELWKEYREICNRLQSKSIKGYNEWIASHGLSTFLDGSYVLKSPYLNIYDFPEEIDYVDTLPPNFMRFDSFIRSEKILQFELPDELINKSGKLIYLSLGSMGAGNVNLMKRLLSFLSKSEHRFIVSKGQLHDQYELADNMWGEKTVPQTKVLPCVDLVITHGGNNTVTESFYFGKPMIVMPLFADQYDNAQRIHETGYGIRLDPHICRETELLEAIETLLNDEKLAVKLNKMKIRIQSLNSLQNIVKSIEKLAHKK